MPYKEINDLRKKGFLDEALRMADCEYEASPGKLEATALFWCLNDLLKHAGYDPSHPGALGILSRMREIRQAHDPSNKVTGKAMAVAEIMMQCGPEEREKWTLYQELRAIDSEPANMKWTLIESYAQIMDDAPSLLHSFMMAEAVKIEKSDSRGQAFLDFAHSWNLDNLRPEDWEQEPGKDGRRQSSLVEKIIGAYMSAVSHTGAKPADKLKALLGTAMEAFPGNLHLFRHCAQIKAIDGDRQCAVDIIRNMLQCTPEKLYLWDDLSRLVEDTDLKIGMLCNAILRSKTDESALNLRLRLADCLCEKGYYANALTELNRFRNIIESHGWALKRWYYDVLHLVPFGVYPVDNARLYSELGAVAVEYVFKDSPSEVYVKVWEQRSGAGKQDAQWLLRHDEEELWIKPAKFLLTGKAHNGTIFKVYRSPQRPSQIAAISRAVLSQPLPWLKVVKGPVQIKNSEPNKVFGFIEGAYVPGSMLYGIEDGAELSALVIRNEGNRWHTLFIYRK